jgi:iron complex outermembrane receptor protein
MSVTSPCVGRGLFAALMFAAVAIRAEAPAAQSVEGLDDIIVTAQRHEQNLQDVPMSVTAFNQALLSKLNVTNATDLSRLDSSLYVAAATGIVVSFLRGIGNPINLVGNESSIAYYVDGVYYARLPTGFFEFNNVERVEVLSGPQGTLFGRNASAGLVQIINRDPSFDPTLHVEVGYANYDTVKTQVYASSGFGDKVAGDIAVLFSNQGDGWGHNLETGRKFGYSDYRAVRSKWKLELGDDTEAKLAVEYRHSVSDSSLPVNQYLGTTSGNTIGPPAQYLPSPFYDSRVDTTPSDTDQGWSYTGNINHDVGSMKLASTTNYQHATGLTVEDGDATPINFESVSLNSVTWQLSEELQLQSEKGSSFDWIAGLYYLDEHAGFDPAVLGGKVFAAVFRTPGAFISNYGFVDTKSYSAYGQATIHVLKTSDITLGARYSLDDLRGYGHEDLAVNSRTLKTLVNVDATKRFTKPTFRLAYDNHFSDQVMGYLSYSRGFKDGTYNLLTISPTPVNPEVLDAAEVGVKSSFLENRLRLNGAAFYNVIHNPQVKELLPGTVTPFLINVPEAKTKGLDFNADAAIAPNLTARVGATLLSAKYTDFPFAPFAAPNPKPPYGNTTYTTINAGVDYLLPTTIGGFNFNFGYYHNGGFYWDPDQSVKQHAYNRFDTRLDWKLPATHWTVSLWGKNITNTQYYLYETEVSGPGGNPSSPAPPATFGIAVSFNTR